MPGPDEQRIEMSRRAGSPGVAASNRTVRLVSRLSEDERGALLARGRHLHTAAPGAIPEPVTLELGAHPAPVGDLIQAEPGTLVDLDRLVGRPVRLSLNGRMLARAEVVMEAGHVAMRFTEFAEFADTAPRVAEAGG